MKILKNMIFCINRHGTVEQVNFAGSLFCKLEMIAVFGGASFCKNRKLTITVNQCKLM